MNLMKKARKNKEITLNSNSTGELFVMKYKGLGVDWNNEMTRQSRGRVIDKDGNVLGYPFDKFFNLEETTNRDGICEEVREMSKWKDEPFTVTNKLDGTFISMFLNPYTNTFELNTGGGFNAVELTLAYKYIEDELTASDKMLLNELVKEYTLMFEYTGLDNLLVVPYNESKLTLIGARNMSTGQLLTYNELSKLINGSNIPLVEKLNLHTKEEVLEYVLTATGIEGVSVFFENSRQIIKIKSPEYLGRHKVVSLFIGNGEISPKYVENIIQQILLGNLGELDDLFSYYKQFRNERLEGKMKEFELLVSEIEEQINIFDNISSKVREWIEFIPTEYTSEEIYSFENYELNGILVPKWLAIKVKTGLSSFHDKQSEYLEVRSALLSLNTITSKKSLEIIKMELGEVGKYDELINPKSYIFQQFNFNEALKEVSMLRINKK